MYSIQQFKNENQGTLVASRGGITGQCVSLVQRWAEVNGVSGSPVFPVANARDMNANTRQDAFTWIPNKVGDPTSKPEPGDIVVFSWNHTGLCEGSDGYTMTLFQQNDPTGSTAHSKNYSFNGCTGWLRLKSQGGASVKPTIEQMRYIHADSEGWDWKECMKGTYDKQFNDSWGWQTLDAMLKDKWAPKNDGWRQRRQDALNYYAQKPANDKVVTDLKTQIQTQQDTITKLNEQLKAAGQPIDQATKDQITDTNAKVSWIKDLLSKIFK